MSELNPFAPPAARSLQANPTLVLEPPQAVAFQPTEADVIAGARHSAQSGPEIRTLLRKQQWRLVILSIPCLALGGFMLSEREFSGLAIFFFGTWMLVAAATLPWINRSKIRARARSYIKSGLILLPEGNLRVELDHSGVLLQEPHVTSQVAWPRVLRVRSSDTHLFLSIHPAAPTAIPMSAFLTEEAFRGYCQLAERLWEQHHDTQQASDAALE